MGTTYVNDTGETKGAVNLLLEQHKDLHGIFVYGWSNWVPEAVGVIKSLGRKDVWVSTFNMEPNAARLLLERGPLWSVHSFSQYFEAGVALVDAVAKWHLGADLPPFVTLSTVLSTPDTVEAGWREVFRNTADAEPPWLKYKGWV